VPKRQESVKVEALDGLHRSPFLQTARERTEPHYVEPGHDRRVQERQVGEPIAQPIVTNWRLGIDVLFLR